jgi:hypothetical protein
MNEQELSLAFWSDTGGPVLCTYAPFQELERLDEAPGSVRSSKSGPVPHANY